MIFVVETVLQVEVNAQRLKDSDFGVLCVSLLPSGVAVEEATRADRPGRRSGGRQKWGDGGKRRVINGQHRSRHLNPTLPQIL